MGEFETLDHDEPLDRHIRRHNYDRLIMLSDGVFSIVLTLLALDIHAPAQIPNRTWPLFVSMLPTLVPFATSFVVTAGYWSLHRRQFSRLVRVDTVASLLTLLFLFLVVLQPVAVRLFNEHSENQAVVRLYYALIVATGAAQSLFWFYVAFPGQLIHASIGRKERLAALARNALIPVLSAVVGVAASWSGHFGLVIALACALLFLVRLVFRIRNRATA